MTERDSDIEFDFFEEPETRETARPQRPPPRTGGPRPPTRSPAGLTPLLRLVGLIAFAIVLIVLLVYAVQGCRSSGKHAEYSNYMSRISAIGGRSQRVGRELATLLTTPGLREADLQRRLAGFARQAQQDVDDARSISPPGRLRDEHKRVIEALQFRVNGLTGLADSFRRNATTKNVNAAATQLSAQAARLLASDVVWDDSFKEPATDVLRTQGIGDVRVPESHVLPSPEFASRTSMVGVVGRIQGTPAASPKTGGLHGMQLVSVKALPKNLTLSATSSENTVIATSDLAFAVTVKDSGDSPEVRIPVTLTIQQTPTPIVKRTVIASLNPGEETTVVFKNLGAVEFTKPTRVKVDVQPVPQEHTTSNNSADYPVIFSLPPA